MDFRDVVIYSFERGNKLRTITRAASAVHDGEKWTLEDATVLDLDDNRLGDEGINDLSQCEFLENIQYLNLNSNGITDAGISLLAKTTKLQKLKRLHLKNNSIIGEGVVALFNSPTLEGLQTFQINDGWTCKKRDGWRYKPQL